MTMVSPSTHTDDKPATHYVPTNTLFIHCESLHGELHAVKTCRLPNEVSNKTMRDLGRDSISPSQLKRNFVRYIYKMNE